MPNRAQRGVALISALLVVALATTAATPLLNQVELGIRKSGNLVARDQAYEYLLGIEQFGLLLLQRDRNDNQVDHLQEFWAQSLPPLPVEGGTVTGRLTDLQGRININNVYDVKAKKLDPLTQERLGELLALLGIPRERVETIIDWIDPDSESSGAYGAEDDTYFGLPHPYRAANRWFSSPDELRLLRDLTPAQANQLIAAVSVIPGISKININTATDLTLRALGLDPAAVEAVKEARPFQNLDAFAKLNLLPKEKIGQLSVDTEYFLLEATARIGRAEQRLYSIIHRAAKGGSPRVVARSLNTL